jgi:hypothetical protein
MEQDEKLEEMIDGLKCQKDFYCYKSKFDDLCKAIDIGLESLLICLEENSQKCKFSVYFGAVRFCQCPLRTYIAKKHKK